MNSQFINRAKIEGSGKPVLNNSPALHFPWWSVTKAVIATCALQLIAQGRLALDEALPGPPYTLGQLIQHRAGVPIMANYLHITRLLDRVTRPGLWMIYLNGLTSKNAPSI